MNDDIVTRLRGGSEERSPAWCWHCEEWGCENADGKSAGCQCEDSCDCANECICECHGWFGVVREAADEIERLRADRDRWREIADALVEAAEIQVHFAKVPEFYTKPWYSQHLKDALAQYQENQK